MMTPACSWKAPGTTWPPGAIGMSIPHGRQSLRHYLDIARLAERGKFDLFMADTNATFGADDVDSWIPTTAASRLEPITLLRVAGLPETAIQRKKLIPV